MHTLRQTHWAYQEPSKSFDTQMDKYHELTKQIAIAEANHDFKKAVALTRQANRIIDLIADEIGQ